LAAPARGAKKILAINSDFSPSNATWSHSLSAKL
jgi:hypothetical protein